MYPYRFFLAALIGAALSIVPVYGAKPDAGTQIVQLAASQLHVREATGRNDGPQVQAYLKTVGLQGNYPWCGAFVAWVYRQLKLAIPAGAGAAKNWFPEPRIIWRAGRTLKPPEPGDLVAYRYGKVRIDHIGIIEIWGSGPTASTLEGNTSGGKLNRDGQGVYRNWRMKSQIYRIARWKP